MPTGKVGRSLRSQLTDRTFLDAFPLTGLCLEDAEDAVNALNQLEIACQRTARKMVDLPHPSAAARSRVDLALTTPHALATAPPLDKAA